MRRLFADRLVLATAFMIVALAVGFAFLRVTS